MYNETYGIWQKKGLYMNILAPSILSADFKNLGRQLIDCQSAGAQYIHIDIMDGVFVPSISFGLPVIKSIRDASDAVFDVHLMITNPIRYIKEFAAVGSDIITFHQEAAPDPWAVIELIHSYGKKAGISIKPGTPIDVLEPYLKNVDMVLIMSVEPGFGGQKYIPSSTDKIRDLRNHLNTLGLKDLDIEVDGGIKTDNVEMVVNAGANVIVAGSAIFNGNVQANVKEFLTKIG